MNLYPRRITNYEIKTALISKYICKFKLPVHKLVVIRNLTHQRKAWESVFIFIFILTTKPVKVNVLYNNIVLSIGFDKRGLCLRVGGLHRATEDQVHFKNEVCTARQQICLTDGPEPEGAPIVHSEFQSCISACVLCVFGLIDTTQELVFFSDRLPTVKTAVLVTVNVKCGDSRIFKVMSCLDLIFPKHINELGKLDQAFELVLGISCGELLVPRFHSFDLFRFKGLDDLIGIVAHSGIARQEMIHLIA